jgi:hypothetical protein
MQYLITYFSLLISIANALQANLASIKAGVPAELPPIRTYIDGKHVEVDIAVNPLP